MNGYEERVINDIANMDNIFGLDKKYEKRGFRINGYINHYPISLYKRKNKQNH
jgi:type III restriction enzyme